MCTTDVGLRIVLGLLNVETDIHCISNLEWIRMDQGVEWIIPFQNNVGRHRSQY